MEIDEAGSHRHWLQAGHRRKHPDSWMSLRWKGNTCFSWRGWALEAGMVERADSELKKKWGPLAYIAGAMAQVKTQESFHADLRSGWGNHIRLMHPSVVVANAAPMSSVFAQGWR
jgi:diacylglycerol kinase (ATP)